MFVQPSRVASLITSSPAMRTRLQELVIANAPAAACARVLQEEFNLKMTNMDVTNAILALGGKDVLKGELVIRTVRPENYLPTTRKRETSKRLPATLEADLTEVYGPSNEASPAERKLVLQFRIEEHAAMLREVIDYKFKQIHGMMQREEDIPRAELEMLSGLSRNHAALASNLANLFYKSPEESVTAVKWGLETPGGEAQIIDAKIEEPETPAIVGILANPPPLEGIVRPAPAPKAPPGEPVQTRGPRKPPPADLGAYVKKVKSLI